MKKEGYLEESVSPHDPMKEARKNMVFRVIAIIAFFLCGIVAFIFVGALSIVIEENDPAATTTVVIFYLFLFALCLGSGIGCWLFKNRYNVSYDYIFVEDELRITKVLNGRKRKYITTLHADRILQIGWVESDAYERACRGLGKHKPKICTPNSEASEGKEFIYIINSTSMEKMVYVVEIRRIMLENLVLAAGRNKLERRQ